MKNKLSQLAMAAAATAALSLGRLFEQSRRRTGGIRRCHRQCDAHRGSAAEHPPVTAEPSKFHKAVETTGAVDFDNDQATSVLAPFSGPVSRLLVSPGDEVKKGEPLAAVDSPDFAAAVSAYQKALATAKTDRRLADLDKDLLQHNGVAQREAAQAETDAVNAEADRDAALQGLVSLNVPASTIKDIQEGRPIAHLDALIRSPVAGTVVEKLITPGELLEAGTTPCFTVADLSRVWVMAQLFGADLASVSLGDTAEVTADTGAQEFPGKVDNISALVDPNTRAVAVRVVADNPQRLLRKQMYVRVRIQARQESIGTAGARLLDLARRREPALRVPGPARRQLRAAARHLELPRRGPLRYRRGPQSRR